MTACEVLGRLLEKQDDVFRHIFVSHWDQHQRKLLLESFDSNTLVIHSDYSAIYDIKNKNRVNSAIDTQLQQEVLVCSHSPRFVTLADQRMHFRK